VTRHDLTQTGIPHRRWSEPWGRRTILYEEVTSDPPRLYRTRVVGDAAEHKLPFAGTWTYEITPTADGSACTCRITEDGEVSNPIFRFVSRFFIGHTRTIDTYLTALCGKFNEPVKLEP
jgi:hypothetical protein